MFSANHRQHLLVAFRHFDSMLAEVLSRIRAEPGEPLFETYRQDSDAPTRERAQAAATRLRETMRAFMAQHDLHAPRPEAGALHSAHALLALMLVGATELGARHLRGYGELDADESAELEALSRRMREDVAALDAALRAARDGRTPP